MIEISGWGWVLAVYALGAVWTWGRCTMAHGTSGGSDDVWEALVFHLIGFPIMAVFWPVTVVTGIVGNWSRRKKTNRRADEIIRKYGRR